MAEKPESPTPAAQAEASGDPHTATDAPPGRLDHGQGAIARRAGVVVVGTFGSRLLGAVRDAVIAAFFSVSATDTFFVAWTIPNTLRRLLAEGAVSAAYIPVFAEIREQGGHGGARRYTAAFTGALGLILLAVCVLGILTAPLWATAYGAGYRNDPLRFSQLVELTRIVFPYILFAGLSALAMGALNALGHFAVPAFAPALLNVALIAAPFALVPAGGELGLSPISSLAVAALVGGLLQVAVHVPVLRRLNMLPMPRIDFRHPGVQRSLALMFPLLLGTGVHQLNIILSRLFASFLPAGAQSYLYYGQRIVEIPQGMFAIAVASATLPSLSALRSQGNDQKAMETFGFSLRLSLFVAIPASVAIAVLAEPTVTVLFGRGAFSPGQVQQTARSLVWLAAGVWAVAAVHGFTRMYHAYGDTRTPVVCAAFNLLTFVTVTLTTLGALSHVAVALGSTAATLVQLVGLSVMLRRRLGPLGGRAIALSAGRSLLAAACMAGCAYDVTRLGHWYQGGNAPRNLLVYLTAVAVGVAVYLAVAYLLKSPELATMGEGLRRKRRS
ncbi:MAG: murein biosynthesis integral membrane protein MurJ [Myxococcales bacterium]|nr:murein biosynthesis integral membrane protein MurJ [Myxococcales bacterium]